MLEVSSFQLDDIQQFRPNIAMLLNITPDHLDRYDYQLENYAAAKFRVTMNQLRGDKFIYNGFDPITLNYRKEHAIVSRAKEIAIRKGFYKNGQIKIGNIVFEVNRGNLRGPHNMFNAACALRAAFLLLKADPAKLQDGLEHF